MATIMESFDKSHSLRQRIVHMSRGRQFWLFQAGGWSTWVILLSIRDLAVVPAEYLPGRITVYFISALIGMALTTGLRNVYRMVWENGIALRILVVLLASLAAAIIWQPFRNYLDYASFGEYLPLQAYSVFDLIRGTMPYAYPLMLLWSGLYFFIKYYQLFQAEKEKSLRSEALAQEAQLRMLRYQLNPHFLFNTLNAISTLVLDKATDQANEMLTKLSKFLRYTLEHSPLDQVSFDHELETSRLYLDIEKVRFGDRMRLEIEVDDLAGRALVPSMLLQPLIENSIKHGLSRQMEGGTIRITARVTAGQLELTVSDSGPGLPDAMLGGSGAGFTGVGLMNVRNRLQEMYGNRQSLVFINVSPHGCQARVIIPYRTKRTEHAESPDSR